MPIVPQAQRQVIQKPLSQGQVSTDAKLEVFGGGDTVKALGTAASQAASDANTMLDHIDNLESERALSEAVKKKNALLLGDPDNGEDGYFANRGKNAMVNMGSYKDKIQQSFSDIEGSLSNDRQKAKFQKALMPLHNEIDSQMNRHALGEAQQYDQQETAASIKNWQDDAILNYTEVGVFTENGEKTSKIRQSLMKQEQLIKSFAARQGFSEDSEFVKNKLLEAQTVTHKGVIERSLANDQDLRAKEYLRQASSAGEIDGSSRADLERLVEAGSLRVESQRNTDAIMNKIDSMGPALEYARKNISDPKLQDEVVQRLKVRFGEKESVKKDIEMQNFATVVDQVEKYKSRDKIPDGQWNSLYPKEQEAINKRIEMVNSGKMVVNDDAYHSDLTMMAANPQTKAKFAAMNLFVEARNKLDDQHYNDLVQLQKGIKQDDPATKVKLDSFRTDTAIVSDALKGAGIKQKDNPEVYNEFNSKIALIKDKYQRETGKSMPEIELQKTVAHQLMDVEVPGSVWGTHWTDTKKIWQLTDEDSGNIQIDVEKIDKDDLVKIKASLSKRNMPLTPENIVSLYRKVRMKGM